ncbi:MAG TPA: ABC transporter permease [Kofleriaceae bacterium]|jgi:NitT/TauT family transport system permease protein|nr:ABC transporter permease [Kofleriaceae bacterium]
MTRRGPLAFVLRLAFLAALIGLWEAVVVYFDLPAFIVPPPSQVGRALYAGITSHLYTTHLYVTLGETLLGFALGCVLAFAAGSAIAVSRTVEYYVYPPVVMFQSTPKVALIPIIVIWFGLGITSKVVSAALVAFFPLMVNTIVGLRSADEDRVQLMRSLAASRWQIFWMLEVPSALPYLFAGLESAMMFALIGAIVAELIGAEKGLGMLMQSMGFNMDTAGEFSILFVLAVLGLVLNGAIRLARHRILFWDRSRDAGVPTPTKGDDP